MSTAGHIIPDGKTARFQQRKATSDGSCTYLNTELGIAVLHGAELLERRMRRRRRKRRWWLRRSLLEVRAKGLAHLLQGSVCKPNPCATAAKAQCNDTALMSIWDRQSLRG